MGMPTKEKPGYLTKDWYKNQKALGITDEKIATELNICGRTFKKWKKELGLGRFRKETLWDRYKEQSLENDVTYYIFMNRIRAGKTPEQAIEEGRKGNGRYGKLEREPGLEYDMCNRIKYNPEFHENHRKPLGEEDLIYICSQYGASSCRDIAFAVGKTENAIYELVRTLRKNGKFEYYKSLDY